MKKNPKCKNDPRENFIILDLSRITSKFFREHEKFKSSNSDPGCSKLYFIYDKVFQVLHVKRNHSYISIEFFDFCKV